MDFKWCSEQPCLARNGHCCIMVHVDDILFCGNRDYWMKTFLVKFAATFKVSHSELAGTDSEISFLKRRIKRVPSGLALLPGTSAEVCPWQGTNMSPPQNDMQKLGHRKVLQTNLRYGFHHHME